jgi:hypothetical protein
LGISSTSMKATPVRLPPGRAGREWR